MNTRIAEKRQVKWLAGIVASIANVLLFVAVIGLADHYAHNAAGVQMDAAALAQQAATASSRNS